MIHVPQWHNENFENLNFQRGVSITRFKEKLIYNLKAKLKNLNTIKKKSKIPISPRHEYPMTHRLQIF